MTRPASRRQQAEAKAAAVADAKSVSPDVPARIGSTPATKFRGNPAIFGRLVEDHDKHRALLAMIEATGPKDPARKTLFEEFVRDVHGHAAAEEQALWSTVMRNPETTEFARHAVGDHHKLDKLDKLMADAAARDITGAGWLRHFAALKAEYLDHILEEETEQFVEAEKTLSDSDQRYMRGVFNRRKKAEKAAAVIEKEIALTPIA
ncbi:hemerythrin domain-containing protein [Caulobacter sp. FWC2]|uniref:hemerythrin domain-containing protein n=1 Tax=Caulobacter sp. FWC2 TaxID=69664 RepID=UPI000C14D934|nr:hemerythrin domain-containing protein [Caulobacter sp. FWC2]PIB92821.1 hemerythrin HHE cation-binding protein [Caulobacter sp. FWC2]